MIVYGDPSFVALPHEIHAAFERLRSSGGIDAAREVLILCGQIEQALADSGVNAAGAEQATDAAAEAFLSALESPPAPVITPFIPETALRLKLPEGFAFYALFPEQYIQAAQSWIREHLETRQALVVGIRSIGTALSAVVAACLKRNRVKVERITVRPTGHPFERQVRLPHAAQGDCAIVVDEGPGLSGSSIATVVSALRRIGARDITIFPGHDHPPGAAASEAVREVWKRTRKIVHSPLSNIQEQLRTRTEQLLKTPVTDWRDLSGGQWREVVRPGGEVPATPALERSKFVFRGTDGSEVLWKFAGLGLGQGGWSLSAQAFHRQRRLARMGWCGHPIDHHCGFIATEWSEGELARKEDCTPRRARALARYVLDASRQTVGDEVENFRRLREMTLCNLKEGLGTDAAERAAILADAVTINNELAAYGDGRLAPHEWLISAQRIIKTDVWGHDSDHTVVSEQSILWDIAGTLVEWEMNEDVELAFRSELRAAGVSWQEPALEFYRIAYLSFRLGVATMFGQNTITVCDRLNCRLSP